MTNPAVAPPARGRQRLVGKVTASVTISNRIDVVLAHRGMIAAEAVRSVTLDGVLVDTGATGLCLPGDIIARLGLELVREAQVETATGFAQVRVFGDASLTVEGRTGTFDCLELPGGRQPLLGVVPLEWLGINLDLANERMELLPDWGDTTYLTIL